MSYVYFFSLILGTYFISRWNLNLLFRLIYHVTRSEKVSYFFISLFFFPGTVVHEAAHALTATFMLLRVRSIDIFPKWEKRELRLGSVLYEKKDPLRSIIVGVAPIFAGMAFFFILAWFKLFPSQTIWLSLLTGYLTFIISSTMFSSRQDLKDAIFVLPIVLLVCGIVYVLIGIEWTSSFLSYIERFTSYINMYLLFCFFIHIILLGILKLISNFIRA